MADKKTGPLKLVLDELPVDRLKDEVRSGLSSLGDKAIGSAGDRLSGLTDKLSDVADNGGFKGGLAKGAAKAAMQGDSPVMGALKGAKDKVKEKLGGGGSKGGKGTKCTNIIEEIDVGVPISVAYNQWTQFQDFSNFMKKVDGVNQEDEVKLSFKAQVFWSHRTWEATILEQVTDDKIVWRSKGAKGHVDGAVTFHELAPNLTRILVVLEYYPQGLFERTGNLWRAQGRRARLELKHFRRHVMTEVIKDPDSVEGWRGVIHDGEVERDHDEVVEEEQQRDEDSYEGDEPEDAEYDEGDEEYDDEDSYDDEESEEDSDDEEESDEESEDDEEPEDEYDEEEPEDEDEYDEEESESEDEDEDDEEEPESEDEYDEDEPEDEYDEEPEEEEEEPAPRRRRRAS